MVTLDQAGAGIPALSLSTAPRGLRDRVECLWVERPLRARHPAHAAWRVVPDASSHLLYHRFPSRNRGEPGCRLVVVGPRTRALDIDKTGRSLTVGVRLRPWASATLLGVPAGELADATWTLESVVGPEAATLEQRLRESPEDDGPSILAAWLRGRARDGETTDERRAREATSRLERQDPCGRAARRVGIGSRRLRTLVRDQVGLPPKALARVARLHRALRWTRALGSDASWSRIAAGSGYYDQSHMIREFRNLLGETPSAWRSRGA